MRTSFHLEALRLTWRLQRWELGVLIGASLLLTAVGAIVAWRLPIVRQAFLECIGGYAFDDVPLACRGAYDWAGYLSGAGALVQGAATVVPLLVGILLGAPLVSREIEKGTAPLAWSLARSRGWWLAGRILPLAVAIIVALLLLGQASEATILAVPDTQLGFQHFAMHGPLVAARGLAVFALGVLIGLWTGRMLPAILLTGVVVVALLAGRQLGRDPIMQAEAVWTVTGEQGLGTYSTIYGSGFVEDATGEFVTDEQAYARDPAAFETGMGELPGLTKVYRVVPPERYPVFVAREIGALAVISIVAVGAALLLVRSRRPE
jgi:hypothetical protein